MTQGFFQFNNSIINEILNFATSAFDLLFVSGPKGSSKSETMEKVIPKLEDTNLVFKHFCFEHTEIDDFLLNFYDSLRNFSLAQRISLKKFTADSFKDKVSHYFRTINKPCVIIVENFEKVDGNIEIIDFLSHLASYVNVKIIIVSRNSEKNLFRFKKIKVKTLIMEQIDKDDFKTKLTTLTHPLSLETKEDFYEMTHGLELYLNMSIKYCTITDVSIEDLISEFKRKSAMSLVDYEEFIVSKFVSITPEIYKELFKILCAIAHPVSTMFLEEYKLLNTSSIDYLTRNFLLSKFKDELYVKDYFKQYIINTFSAQEKVTYYKALTDIYENELTKSPKDRLIRLSRESIRKEIKRCNSLIPSVSSKKSGSSFPYIGLSGFDKEKTSLADKLNRIKERKKELEAKRAPVIKKIQINEKEEKEKRFIIQLINSSRQSSSQYKYHEAIAQLKEAQNFDEGKEFNIEILCLIAQNYEFLNEFLTSQKYYNEARQIAIQTNDTRKCEIEFYIAQTNKNLYKIENAKSQFKQIALDEKNPQNYRAKAYLELGEIEEANSNIMHAIENYNNSLNLSLGKDKELVCKCYYRLATLYDENQDIENAVKYYQKNYTTSSEKKDNKYYSISLTNLALIYIEQSQYKQATDFLRLALDYDSENNDLENMYFSQKELAKLYSKTDTTIAKGYYKEALDSAQKLNDAFKEALVYFEIGEFYYDKQNDRLALYNFFKAKSALKTKKDDENIARINSRINDIKIRLGDKTFSVLKEEYEKNSY